MKFQNKYLVLHKFFQMNKRLFFLVVVVPIIFSSCATIFGGRKYNAIVKTNRPNAEIWLNYQYIGHGHGNVLVARKNANKIYIEIKERGCLDTQFFFRSRKLRPLALANAIAPFAASIILPTNNNTVVDNQYNTGSGVRSVTYSFPNNSSTNFLYGIWVYAAIADFINFSTMYKPDEKEPGIHRLDYKNYEYNLNSSCIPVETTQYINNSVNNNSNIPTLKGSVYLKNGSVIRGHIIEIIPNKTIRLQTIDGSIFVFKFDDIERYSQEK